MPDWPNMKRSDFGVCEAVLLPPKVNKDACTGADVVIAILFDVLIATLLKLALVTFVLTGDDTVPID